jgi:preprotein translocase subunit SecB
MIITSSKHLRLNKFYITDQTVLTKYPGDKQRIHLDKLSIDMDYEIFQSEEKDHSFDFLVILNIKCNLEEKPGYIITLGAVGEFTLIKDDKMSDKTEQAFILGSALPMIINSARIFLANTTSLFAFGKYTLPIIDMGPLLSINKEKGNSEEETK